MSTLNQFCEENHPPPPVSKVAAKYAQRQRILAETISWVVLEISKCKVWPFPAHNWAILNPPLCSTVKGQSCFSNLANAVPSSQWGPSHYVWRSLFLFLFSLHMWRTQNASMHIKRTNKCQQIQIKIQINTNKQGTAVWTRIEMCRDFFVKASLTFFWPNNSPN